MKLDPVGGCDQLGIDSMTLESTEVHMEFSEHFPLHHQPVLSAEELMESMAERGQRMLRAGCLGLGYFSQKWNLPCKIY